MGRNKLTRPKPPPPPPPPPAQGLIEHAIEAHGVPPTTRTYQRRRHRKGASSSQETQVEVAPGPSQPIDPTQASEEEDSPDEIPLSMRKPKRTPRELRRLKN